MNRLYFGDNLRWLSDRKEFPEASVDLVTLENQANRCARTQLILDGTHSKLWHDKDYPKIHILTVESLLNGTERIDAPNQLNPFAMVAREQERHEQGEIL